MIKTTTLLIELRIPSNYGDNKDCVKLIRKWLENIEKDDKIPFLSTIHIKDLTQYNHDEVNEIYCKNCVFNNLQ